MTPSTIHSSALSILALASVLCACSAAPSDPGDDGAETDEAALRTISTSEKVGTLAFGQSRTVDYAESPLYRALRIDASTGDVLDVWVRGSGIDAKAWLVDSGYRTLAYSDNADTGTLDAHVTFKATRTGAHYVVLREKNRESGRFEVSLAARGVPGGGAPAEGAYGFTPDRKVAARGSGTNTQNIGPSYQCKRKTTSRLPCGGWVSFQVPAGKPQVVLGAMGHYGYYSSVSGHASGAPERPFPPTAENPFWNQSAVVELDALGHGHFDQVNKDAQGFVRSTASFDVQATAGSVTVDFRSSLGTGCNSHDETCTFRVLAP